MDPITMLLMQALPAIGTFAVSGLNAYMGLKGLRELNKQPRPNYSVSPEMAMSQNRSFINSKYGFTPQQTGDFNQRLAMNQSGNFRNQVNMGGGSLAQALSSRGNAQNLGAINQYASQDAALLNQNIRYNDQVNSNIQNQLNRKVGQDIDYRMSDEKAIGGSLQAGLGGLGSAGNMMGSLAYSNMGGQLPNYNNNNNNYF